MSFTWIALVVAAALFVGMLAAFEIGRRIGVARLVRDPEGLTKGAGAAEGAVFALLGLLIAFTFSGAASRFEGRRMLIDTEANAIGTAWMRIDLLPDETQPALRELLRSYTGIRSTVYQGAHDIESVKAKLTEAEALQGKIWAHAVAACKQPGASPQAAMLLLPALNDMIDITATRAMATQNHPPVIIFALLAILSLLGALLVGFGTSQNKDRSWLHQVTFALITSLAFYVIIDLEYPRLGLIRVDSADQVLIDLANSMR